MTQLLACYGAEMKNLMERLYPRHIKNAENGCAESKVTLLFMHLLKKILL